MKAPTLLLTLLFATLTVWLPALSVEELQVSYQAAVLKANESRDNQIETLNQRYTTALTRLQEEAQKKGDLDKALAIKGEVDLIGRNTWPLPPVPEKIAKVLRRPRQTYLKTRLGVQRDWALKSSNLADRMEEALEAQMASLTKSGKLEEARSAQELLEKIRKDPELARARELPSRVTQRGRSRAGFLVRRNGDNLEVLVRYDSEGKISLKSPIENMVEQTGGKREKGKTSARTLGEFVGAGAEVTEPYVALEHTLENQKIEFTDVFGTEVKFLPDEGTELRISPRAKNAFLGIDGVFSTSSSPATYRLTAEVMVPSNNAALKGLYFRHGGSKGTVIGKPVEGNGKWQEVLCEGAGGSEINALRIHFTGFLLKDFPKARGDRVIIKSLKVEYLCFSAHIVEQYGDSGEAIVAETDPSKQKLLVTNGVLVEAPN